MFQNPDWAALSNFFYSSTKGSFKKMYQLATDHLSKLRIKAATDPDIQDILTFFEPFYFAFLQQYERSIDGRTAYHAKTAEFNELLEEVTGPLLRRWAAEIQISYDNQSRQYKSFFPQGRRVFQNNSLEVRIQLVKTLGRNLLQDPQLATLGTTVAGYGQQLEDLRNEQQGLEYHYNNNSTLLEQQREELSLGLFACFARLEFHYYRDINQVADFYELKYFRRSNNDSSEESTEEEDYGLFEIDLAAESRSAQLEGLLRGGENIRITHLEGEPLKYYSAANATDSPAQIYELQPNQSASLQLPAGHRLLFFDNPASQMAKVELELM